MDKRDTHLQWTEASLRVGVAPAGDGNNHDSTIHRHMEKRCVHMIAQYLPVVGGLR